MLAQTILQRFLCFYFYYNSKGKLSNYIPDENLPANMCKTIWLTYYIDLLKVNFSETEISKMAKIMKAKDNAIVEENFDIFCIKHLVLSQAPKTTGRRDLRPP